MATIRKNAFNKISGLLNQSVLIRCVNCDDMISNPCSTVTAQDVIEAGEKYEFSRVSLHNNVLHCVIHRNLFYVAYLNVEAARGSLTSQAFNKYFPGEAA